MNIHTLERRQFLPTTIDHAWQFFCDPANLARITPPDMGFNIITDLNGVEMHEGLLIEYRVIPLLGIKMKWVTKIGKVEKPYVFTDTQLQGPYALWEHTHTFAEKDGGVDMKDVVRYAIPLGPLGDLAHALFVKARLNHIFDYRYKVLEEMFKR